MNDVDQNNLDILRSFVNDETKYSQIEILYAAYDCTKAELSIDSNLAQGIRDKLLSLDMLDWPTQALAFVGIFQNIKDEDLRIECLKSIIEYNTEAINDFGILMEWSNEAKDEAIECLSELNNRNA